MTVVRSIATRPAGGRPNVVRRLMVAMALITSLLAVAAGSPRTVRADNGRVTAVTTHALGQFDAAALLPSGPLTAVTSFNQLPAGYTLKHHHGGARFIYLVSGSEEVTDDMGTRAYHAGDFWFEPQGHSHTAHVVSDASYFALDLLPPGAQATIPEAPATGPTNTQRTILGTIDASDLFPTGPLNGTASTTTFPTGYMLKHYHGGPRFIYVLSGTEEITDDAGTKTYHAGDFFMEMRGHLHTAHTIAQTQVFALDFLQPGIKTTYPLVGALPAVTPSGPGMTGSFTATFSSILPGRGLVLFGTGPGCAGLVETALSDSGSGMVSHSVTVRGNDLPGTVGDIGIQPGVTYWFETVTATRAGVEIDNNDGKCYYVTIPTS